MPPKKKTNAPALPAAGPLDVDTAAAVALEAVGAPLIGPHVGRTKAALRLYLSEEPAAELAACAAEEAAIEAAEAARVARLAELRALIEAKVKAARLEVWELEVEARRLASGTSEAPDTGHQWVAAITPRWEGDGPPVVDPKAYSPGAKVVYPGGHEGTVRRSGYGGSFTDADLSAVIAYSRLPSGWLRGDHEVHRELVKRRGMVAERKARVTLARVVAFSAPPRTVDWTGPVWFPGAVTALGPSMMVWARAVYASAPPEAAGWLYGGRWVARKGLFVRDGQPMPGELDVCEWATRALHWLDKAGAAGRLVSDGADDGADDGAEA